MSLNKKLICLIIVSAIALSAVIAIKTLKQDGNTDFKRGTLVKAGCTCHISRTNSDVNLYTIKGDFYEYYI